MMTRFPKETEGADERVTRKTKGQSETHGRSVSELDAVDLGSAMLTTGQVASYLNVSQPTVRHLIKMEGLPAIKLQRRYRIPPGPFEEWLRHRAVGFGDSDE